MPDSPKVHLLVEGRWPGVPTNRTVLLMHDGRCLDTWNSNQARRLPQTDAWLPLPTASDLTVEDVRLVLSAALWANSQTPDDVDRIPEWQALADATARLRAALGMEHI